MNKIIIVDMKYYSNIICLTADSMVRTPYGELRIDCIKPGMEIVSYDIHSASCVYDTVYKTARSLHDHCAKVVFDNGISFILTVDHPIYVENKGWCVVCMSDDKCAYGVSVSQLNVGDLCVVFSQGDVSHARVVSVDIMSCSEDFYCFSTVKNHSFFANDILVRDVNIDFLSQEQIASNHVVVV